MRWLCLAWWLCWATANADAAPIVVTDDNARKLTLDTPASRIVTLAPSLTELAFTAGAGDKIVGVSSYSDDPQEAKSRRVVSDATGVNLEALLALKPDLVIAWKSGNKSADIERLVSLGIPVYVAEVAKLSDVPRALRDIGRMASTFALAERRAAEFETAIRQLREEFANKKKIRVFFEISRQPLMTINGQHAIDEIITLCGGENVFKNAPVLVPQLSIETLFAREPDVILYPAEPTSGNAAPWERYRGLRAQKSAKIFRVSPDPILRAGSKMVEGAREVCRAIERGR
jgi:iron complex transport system substrate-binding protein